jgi:DNA modification methylase
MELNKVYNEDCLIGMSRIADKSVDMILCDLPYGTTACKWDVIIPFEPLWQQYERIIKDNGAIVLTAAEPFSSALRMSNIKNYKYDWIWEKSHARGFLNAWKQPLRKTEDVCVFYNKQCTYNPQITDKPKENIRPVTNSTKLSDCYGQRKLDVHKLPPDKSMPIDILKFNTEQNQIHPTQKPVALFEYLIKTYTNEGETVLDNCAGSGTTMIACINTNRNYIGFEKEEKYYQIIQDRIKNHTPQLKLIA